MQARAVHAAWLPRPAASLLGPALRGQGRIERPGRPRPAFQPGR
jgi:hypothetical protein